MQRCVWVRVPSGAPQKRTRRKSCPFLWTPRAKARSALRDFNARGGKAAPAPRFSPTAKTLVRRTRAAAQKGRWVVFLQRSCQSKISILTIPSTKKDTTYVVSFFVDSAGQGPLRPSGFQCSGRQSRPCAKVFTCGENACTAHSRRGPEGPFGGSFAAVPSIQNIDFNRPFHDECSYSI